MRKRCVFVGALIQKWGMAEGERLLDKKYQIWEQKLYKANQRYHERICLLHAMRFSAIIKKTKEYEMHPFSYEWNYSHSTDVDFNFLVWKEGEFWT